MGIISESHDFAFFDAYPILYIDILRLVLSILISSSLGFGMVKSEFPEGE